MRIPLNIYGMLAFHRKLFFLLPKPTLVDNHQKSRNCTELMLEYEKNGFALKYNVNKYIRLGATSFQFINVILNVLYQENP